MTKKWICFVFCSFQSVCYFIKWSEVIFFFWKYCLWILKGYCFDYIWPYVMWFMNAKNGTSASSMPKIVGTKRIIVCCFYLSPLNGTPILCTSALDWNQSRLIENRYQAIWRCKLLIAKTFHSLTFLNDFAWMNFFAIFLASVHYYRLIFTVVRSFIMFVWKFDCSLHVSWREAIDWLWLMSVCLRKKYSHRFHPMLIFNTKNGCMMMIAELKEEKSASQRQEANGSHAASLFFIN